MSHQAYYQYGQSVINGAWVSIHPHTTEDDICEHLEDCGFTGDELFVSDIEGPLLSIFYDAQTMSLDLENATEALQYMEEFSLDEDAIAGFLDHYGMWDAQAFEDAYCGTAGSEEQFTQELCEEIYPELAELPSIIHIDWEATARDLFMGDYYFVDGHVYRAV